MKTLILALLVMPAFAEDPVPHVDSLISYAVPKGWKAERNEHGVQLSRGSQEIGLRVDGGEGAAYETLEDYAKALGIGAPTERSEIDVAGAKTPLYTTQASKLGQHPHVKRPIDKINAPRYTVLLPLDGGKFLVLQLKELSPAPTPRGRKAFESFLKTVRFKAKPR